MNAGTEMNRHNNFQNFFLALICLFRCATGESWQMIMLDCAKGSICDPKTGKVDPENPSNGLPECGSQLTYIYFTTFVFLSSFLMLNLFVAVIMDNFDYLTRDSSILGSHHLDEFSRVWSEYDPSASWKIHYTQMYDMLRNIPPPVGFGNNCPYRLAYKHLIRMNMPLDENMEVHFTTTLFALIRESLSIKIRPAQDMDTADQELREVLKKIWPLQTKKGQIDLCVPPEDDLAYQKLTVGKIYSGLLILEAWRRRKSGLANQHFGTSLLDPTDCCLSPSTGGVASTNHLPEPLQSATDADPSDTLAFLIGRLKPHNVEAAGDSDQAEYEASEHSVRSEQSAAAHELVYSSLSIDNAVAPDSVQNTPTLKRSRDKRREEDQNSSQFLSSRHQKRMRNRTPFPSQERRPFSQEYSPAFAREIRFSKVVDPARDATYQCKDKRSLGNNRGLHEELNLHHISPRSTSILRRLPDPEDPFPRHMPPTDYNPRRSAPRLDSNFRSTSLHDRSQTPSPDHQFRRPRHFASTYKSHSADSSEAMPRRRLPIYAKAIHATTFFNNRLPRNMPTVEHSPTMPILRTWFREPSFGNELQFPLPRVCPSPTMHPNRIHPESLAFQLSATIPPDNIIAVSDLEYDSDYDQPFWTGIGGHSQQLSSDRMNLAGNMSQILPSLGQPTFTESNESVRRSFVDPIRNNVPIQSSYQPLVRSRGMDPFRRNQIYSTSATMMAPPRRLSGPSYYVSAFNEMPYRYGTLAPRYQTSLRRNTQPNGFRQALTRKPLHTVIRSSERIERPMVQFRGQGPYVHASEEHWF